uniref:Uncharacterized protein n=1 Tax=Pseudomonas savastanoi TaxID=29438 RepID=Q52509_PSESS|nr:unknown protein [Pseudomonas savastanoi]
MPWAQLEAQVAPFYSDTTGNAGARRSGCRACCACMSCSSVLVSPMKVPKMPSTTARPFVVLSASIWAVSRHRMPPPCCDFVACWKPIS